MRYTVKQIVENLTDLAPIESAEDWDNCGLLVGDTNASVETVLVALDITPSVVEQAVQLGAQLIVSHHPVIFAPMRTLKANSVPYSLVKHGIAACCLHTCLDKAEGGVNDALAERFELNNVSIAEDGYTRIGTLKQPMNTSDFIDFVENSLNTKVRFHGDRMIEKVAVVGGSGGDFIDGVLDQVDAVITGEIKHHEWLAVQNSDRVVIEAGHFATEHPVVDTLAKRLQALGVQVVTATEQQPYVVK